MESKKNSTQNVLNFVTSLCEYVIHSFIYSLFQYLQQKSYSIIKS